MPPSTPAAIAPTHMPATTSADATRYGGVAIVLHWVLALAIAGTFCVGLYMAGLPFSVLRVKLINWHKWAGISILALSLLRLSWRLTHRPPPLGPRVLEAMPPWQHSAHRATHLALYVLFFVVPLLGWAYSSAVGLQIVWFGVLPLPNLLPLDKELGNLVLKPLHQASAFVLAALVVLHVAAALKHQFIDRDGLLLRMWPGTR
jgi:cytochrome b561